MASEQGLRPPTWQVPDDPRGMATLPGVVSVPVVGVGLPPRAPFIGRLADQPAPSSRATIAARNGRVLLSANATASGRLTCRRPRVR
jgi:hypothetical protein